MKKRSVLSVIALVIATLLSACSGEKTFELSGTYLNLDETAIVHSYSFSPDPENAQSGSYTLVEDFSKVLEDGSIIESSGGWALDGNILTTFDSRLLEMQELLKALGQNLDKEYEGQTWYVFDDYLIDPSGYIEPSVDNNKTFEVTAEWGKYSYSFKKDGTVSRSLSDASTETGSYSRKGNIVTCSFQNSEKPIILVVYNGLLYKENSIFQKETGES